MALAYPAEGVRVVHLRRSAIVLSLLTTVAAPAAAASLDKSVDVALPAADVWARIGPFCAIKDWHPAIGACTEAGSVRTLTTKDGKATFVERETARDDRATTYSYAIEKSPLPLTKYVSTLKVTAKGKDRSTVQWLATYTPDAGKEMDAATAIGGIYQAGLDNIRNLAR
jgi:Polyketide cyclase / dehydrase and lipid transport